jgi:hypothetical protein
MNDQTSALLGAVQESLREQLEAAERTFQRLQHALSTRDSDQIAALNRAVRRLRAAASGDRWTDALVAGAQAFCDRAALLYIRGTALSVEAARGFDAAGLAEVPLSEAPAFRTCLETRDSVVAMRTGAEMSPALASRLGETSQGKFYLFPVTSRTRVVAILYADAQHGDVQSDALELLATVAGAVVEHPAHKSTAEKFGAEKSANGLVRIAGTAIAGGDEHELHVKARRFARVQAAEIRLYKSENVKNGRAGRDLYTSLKTEIDAARQVYRRDFIVRSPSMVDYLHGELVRTIANDDAALLGPEYPGPLV